MRKIMISIIVIALIGLGYPVYGTADAEQPVLPAPPEVSARTALVMDVNTGKILYDKKGEEKIFPASTTKIMTALLALENGNLAQKVKVSQNAAGVEGSSIYLTKDEIIPLEDLLYGLMLRSGNDAATAIAEEVGGNLEGFVEMMNRRAADIGAENTHFMNPSGLHHEEHYTTAKDMAMIAREAMQNPDFKKVAASKTWVCDRGEGKYNYFYNKNKVVYQYEGGTGIKIGYTQAAGRTLVASSERDGIELICVVMDAPNWFQDTYRLMDYVYNLYEPVTVLPGERPLKASFVGGGDKSYAMVGLKEDIVCPIIKGGITNISVKYTIPKKVRAPIQRWQEAGTLDIYMDDVYLFSKPLYYLEDIG